MRFTQILSILEGNEDKQAFIKLSDGTEISPICYGTNTTEHGDTFLVVSEEKSKRNIPSEDIVEFYFPE